ncbi:hypothetical protein L2E82_39237 [Cichorium intybus]|uniref:Uncharacterized protein n=1 Tax=Cichorium intybus TaxID=13427 RepID=A0ACB9AHM4_CICIN|nr:hypothetical protein L2E82_39237 [Cichorium intybus]
MSREACIVEKGILHYYDYIPPYLLFSRLGFPNDLGISLYPQSNFIKISSHNPTINSIISKTQSIHP